MMGYFMLGSLFQLFYGSAKVQVQYLSLVHQGGD